MVSDDVNATIARMWQRSRPTVLERVTALEETARALTAGRADAEAIVAARTDAHKLIGSLGTFGVQGGSELARRIEEELEAGGQDPPRLNELAVQLRTLIEGS